MGIDPAQVENIARLSRLAITEEEKIRFGAQLSSILEYIKKLDELDTTDVEPTSHVLDLTNVLRQDEVRESSAVEEILANAPDRSGTFYRVPKIIQ